MNRLSVLFLILLLLSGCASSLKTADPAPSLRYVSFQAPEFMIHSSTGLFSEETIQRQLNDEFVTTLGDRLLKQVLIGYGEQTEAFRYTSSDGDDDVQFIIRKVDVSRAYFTINLPHPGPVYKVRMHVDLVENGIISQSVIIRQRANMSEINFPKERFKWLTPEEKANTLYQEQTFRVAVRKLYQQLYFTYFDISLQL